MRQSFHFSIAILATSLLLSGCDNGIFPAVANDSHDDLSLRHHPSSMYDSLFGPEDEIVQVVDLNELTIPKDFVKQWPHYSEQVVLEQSAIQEVVNQHLSLVQKHFSVIDNYRSQPLQNQDCYNEQAQALKHYEGNASLFHYASVDCNNSLISSDVFAFLVYRNNGIELRSVEKFNSSDNRLTQDVSLLRTFDGHLNLKEGVLKFLSMDLVHLEGQKDVIIEGAWLLQYPRQVSKSMFNDDIAANPMRGSILLHVVGEHINEEWVINVINEHQYQLIMPNHQEVLDSFSLV